MSEDVRTKRSDAVSKVDPSTRNFGRFPVIRNSLPSILPPSFLWHGDAGLFLDQLPSRPLFDFVVTSPPYNIGKEYESRTSHATYLDWQRSIIEKIVVRLKYTGSICWQVGNFVKDGEIVPLDVDFIPIFRQLGLKLRNRIVWHFGHGLHAKRRFSGRYEVVLWFTRSDTYSFNLDAVRIPAKYPGKTYHKGPKRGQLSGNPLGKNPDDIWEIPNVKAGHIEKTEHPCQFPVGLITRLILALTKEDDVVFDPFAGVASAGVAALLVGRRFWGAELVSQYVLEGRRRLLDSIRGTARIRPHDKPVQDPLVISDVPHPNCSELEIAREDVSPPARIAVSTVR